MKKPLQKISIRLARCPFCGGDQYYRQVEVRGFTLNLYTFAGAPVERPESGTRLKYKEQKIMWCYQCHKSVGTVTQQVLVKPFKSKPTNTPKRFCSEKAWVDANIDTEPRAIRWASRLSTSTSNIPRWTKWHYTEGNAMYTACGEVVKLFKVNGSPETGKITRLTCKRCIAATKNK